MNQAEKTYPDYEEMERYWNEGYEENAVKAAVTTKADLVRDLRAMGVEGRHVMVHASYKLLSPVDGGPQTVVDAFVDAVGEKGCLLFPTYDFERWTERGYWDRSMSPSRMGVITEMARNDERFRRTPHPMLSYAVWNDPDTGRKELAHHGAILIGADPESDYLQDSPNAHGAQSVFDKLYKNNGLLISIGAEKQSGFRSNDVGFTMSNHAAVLAGAPWRRMKVFEGLYCWLGFSEIRKYAASVNADPSRYVTEVTPAHFEAERKRVITRALLGHTWCWVASAREFLDWAVVSHKERPELWRREMKTAYEPTLRETEDAIGSAGALGARRDA